MGHDRSRRRQARSFLSVAVFAYYRPFRDPFDNHLQLCCLINTFLQLLAIIALREASFPEDVLNAVLILTSLFPIPLAIIFAFDHHGVYSRFEVFWQVEFPDV